MRSTDKNRSYKKMDFTGTGQVYRFTLQQQFNSKANKIVFACLIFLAAAMIPVMSLFFGGSDLLGGGMYTLQSSVSTVEEYLNRGQISYGTKYGIQYAYSIVTMIICVFSVTYIVRAIVEEKSSKLVETLMVSVKPLALIFGKILAVMTYMFAMLLSLLAAFGLSYVISGQFLDVSFVGDMLASFGITSDLLHIGVGTGVIILVSILLAYLTFALLAGLTGAGCSNTDEVEGANSAAMMMILVGYLVSSFTIGIGGNATVALAICPIISAFSAPAYFIFGEIGFGVILASWAVQIIVIMLILLLTARVYDQLIMYRGSKLKMKQIIALGFSGKTKRKETVKEEN